MQVGRIPGGQLPGGSGERGSKAWVTYPGDRDSRPNGRVIPGDVAGGHPPATKRSSAPGGAHVVLASWRGDGPPRPRCLAGVRARPAHWHLDTGQAPTGGWRPRFSGKGGSPTGGRRGAERGPWVVKALRGGGKPREGPDRPPEEARAKFVPAAAV